MIYILIVSLNKFFKVPFQKKFVQKQYKLS